MLCKIESEGVKKMNWKKLLLIALAVTGFAFASATSSQAGVSVGIGLGFPIAYGYPYPYGYGYPYYGPYYRTSLYVGPQYYWYHGRRVYYPRRSWHRR
jgi:hypothetical protein